MASKISLFSPIPSFAMAIIPCSLPEINNIFINLPVPNSPLTYSVQHVILILDYKLYAYINSVTAQFAILCKVYCLSTIRRIPCSKYQTTNWN